MATSFTLTVENSDGATVDVVATQRDIVAFERAERISVSTALDEMPTAFFWYMAWSGVASGPV